MASRNWEECLEMEDSHLGIPLAGSSESFNLLMKMVTVVSQGIEGAEIVETDDVLPARTPFPKIKFDGTTTDDEFGGY